MNTEIWQRDRPKGRKPVWAFRVTDGATLNFDSQRVANRLVSREAASWIAQLVEKLRGVGKPLEWRGDLQDDCSATRQEYAAHAEHLQGPKRGGSWYCSVSRDGKLLFNSADRNDIHPSSGAGARWLCELVISAAESGVFPLPTS